MKLTLCDAKDCKEEAFHSVDVCHGFTSSIEGPSGAARHFKPFTKGADVVKFDLCERHFIAWCRATYVCFFGEPKGLLK